MTTRARDDNDRLRDGDLSLDPDEGTTVMQAPPAPVAKMSDALADAYGAVLQGPPLTPLSSGFVDIDTEIPHFAPRQVTMLAADSGVGKSTVATQFALHGSAQKHGVIYFNLEMDPGMFGLRTTANFAKLPVRLNLDAEQHARFKAGLVTLARPASRIALGNRKDHRTIPAIKKFCEQAKAELDAKGFPVSLIVIDHVLEVMVSVKNDKDAEGKARADMLKELAETFNAHVLALVHITREGSKLGTMPTKNSLASSAWFDRAADNIMILHQKRSPDGTFAPHTPAILSCQKSRWGKPFRVELEYQGGMFFPWRLGGEE